MAANNDNATHTASDTQPEATVPQVPVAHANGFSRMWTAIVRFLREVRIELKKTNWPSRNELTKFSIVVIVTIVVVSVFLFVSDAVVAAITKQLFHLPDTGSNSPFG